MIFSKSKAISEAVQEKEVARTQSYEIDRSGAD